MQSDQVQEVKDRVDIVEVISTYLTLKKAGSNFKANCPFHNEKTPSLMISPERQTFKCFGCGEGGDVITFIEKIEGLDFFNALKLLADRAGIQLKTLTGY
jgi:DNA primase